MACNEDDRLELRGVLGVLDEALRHIVDAAGAYDDEDEGRNEPDLVLAMASVRAAQRALGGMVDRG